MSTAYEELDQIAISVRSHRLLNQLLDENPELGKILSQARNETEVLIGVRNWIQQELSPAARAFVEGKDSDRALFEALNWKDYAAIRILDYVDNAGREFKDLNLRGEIAVSNPLRMVWMAVAHGTGGAKPYFFQDMLHLFRQLRGAEGQAQPSGEEVQRWMARYLSGTDPRIVKLREENRERIINVLIDKIDQGLMRSARYQFDPGLSRPQKFLKMLDWWAEWRFHLAFAVRDPDVLNEMLGWSLDPDTMKILHAARDRGIPFFVNPYYLSLLHVRVPYFAVGADLAIRHYVVYSQQLVDEFGHIVAWEKEDEVEVGKPNAAGWLLPSRHAVHRRYPDVAILIPETVGRACGGLCSVCQRMFDFQNGNLNFDLDKLRPDESWSERLARYMEYFENDAQLRDILITGGDALMSSVRSLRGILDAIYEMALRKREANRQRPEGQKYAEMLRVRLGTRMPVYLPQRVTPELTAMLAEFRERASQVGIEQFVVQTHFESPMEVTPESKEAVRKLLSAGWMVTNQLVFTVAASRRGHTAALREALNEVGVLPYYTFAVKGYMENNVHFAPNARAVQEQLEEKPLGTVPPEHMETIRAFPQDVPNLARNIANLQRDAGLPFLATDRNVLNLPAVGKSLTYRVIGITRYGRRILAFDHDATRSHSPIIEKMGKVMIVESKSIAEYLAQLEEMGENQAEYDGLYGYSLGVTERRMPIYEYPAYSFELTDSFTNLRLGQDAA